MGIYKEGQRVILIEDLEVGLPEEHGVVIEGECNGVYVVQLDKEYIELGDDGIREVSEEQMREE